LQSAFCESTATDRRSTASKVAVVNLSGSLNVKKSRIRSAQFASGLPNTATTAFTDGLGVRRWTALIHLCKAVHLLKIDNTTAAICSTTLYYGRKIALNGR